MGSFESTVAELQEEIKNRKSRKGFSGHSGITNSIDTAENTHVRVILSEANKGGNMDLNELLTNHPDLVSQIKESAIADTKAAITAAVEALKTEKDNLAAQVLGMTESLKKLERENLKNRMEVAKAKSDKIAADIIGKSTVPEKFHGKVLKQADFQKFVDSDGSFDEKGFGDAFGAEVAEWEASFSDFQKFSGVVTDTKDTGCEDKTDSSIVDEILASIGLEA